jgi:hypothetical protein
MAVIDPKKNTVGTAKACTESQRTVKIGYVNVLFDDINFFNYTHNSKRNYDSTRWSRDQKN